MQFHNLRRAEYPILIPGALTRYRPFGAIEFERRSISDAYGCISFQARCQWSITVLFSTKSSASLARFHSDSAQIDSNSCYRTVLQTFIAGNEGGSLGRGHGVHLIIVGACLRPCSSATCTNHQFNQPHAILSINRQARNTRPFSGRLYNLYSLNSPSADLQGGSLT